MTVNETPIKQACVSRHRKLRTKSRPKRTRLNTFLFGTSWHKSTGTGSAYSVRAVLGRRRPPTNTNEHTGGHYGSQ